MPESPEDTVHSFKLGICAERHWRHLRGFRKLGKVAEGIGFRDGIEVRHLND